MTDILGLVDVQEREAGPRQVRFSLSWTPFDRGMLSGQLWVINVSRRTVRVSGKPILVALGVDGQPLSAGCFYTLEGKIPPYVLLAPRAEAFAWVGWSGWTGPPASGRFVVKWPGGQVEIVASGPRQPTSDGTDTGTGLSTSWFRLPPDQPREL